MANNNSRNEEPDWDTDEEGSSEEESSEDDGSQEDSSQEGSESEDDAGSDEANSSEDDDDDEDDDGSSDRSKSDGDDDNESNSDSDNSDGESDSDSNSGDDGDGSVFRDEEEKVGRNMSSGSLMNEAGQSTTWTKCVPSCIVGMGITAAALFCCCIISIPLLAIIIGLAVGLSGDNDNIEATPSDFENILDDLGDVDFPSITFQPTRAPTLPPLKPDSPFEPDSPLEPIVTLLSDADTTIYRDGLLQSSAYGDEMTMLVQNGPPGDPEIASAYSLVQFDGIQGIDSDTMSIDAYLSSIDDLTVELCLTRAVSDDDSGTNIDGTNTVIYSTCLLPSTDTAIDIETLTGDTAPEYTIPESCVNDEVTTFEVGPSTKNLCIDVTSLFGKTSSTSNSDSSMNSPALRGLRRRFLQEDDETTPTTTTTQSSTLFMIDTLKESDKPGDRFYSRADINGRQPSLKIIGENACRTTVDTACTDPQFSTLCSLISKSDLGEILDSPDAQKTVFAPTNDAFDRLSPGTLEALNDIDLLVDVLQYHITSGKLMSEDLECGLAIDMTNSRPTTTLCGSNGTFYQVGGGVTPGLPEIVVADIETCNGVIHGIDEVLIPVDPLGGDTACISNETESIADIACTDPDFAAFCGLVRQAGIGDILAGGVFTIFAPSNAAFQVALQSLGQSVDMQDKGVITDVLLQHIIWGSAVYAKDLTCDMTVLMGNDENNTITCKDDAFFVGGPGNDENAFPGIVSADRDACNGVIHVIDGVIIPEIDVTNNPMGNSTGDDEFSSIVDIPTTAINAGILNTLVAALGAADLVDAVSDPNGPFTVFAPTDDAFASLPEGLVPCLLLEDNKSVLSNILLYHVADGEVLSTDLTNGMDVTTLLGQDVVVDLNDGVKINNSTVIAANVPASNGVIHIIDQVLVPSDVDVAAFLDTCGDTSLVDIPTTAINAGTFETLVAALGAADLVEAVSDPNGPFTVFAPTDDAFAALPNGLVTCLLEEDNKSVLSDILLYHVADGKVLSTDLSDGQQIATKLADNEVTVDLSDGDVKINESNVIGADVLASNGVIHVIDQVLVPSSIDLPAFLETCGDDETTDEVEI